MKSGITSIKPEIVFFDTIKFLPTPKPLLPIGRKKKKGPSLYAHGGEHAYEAGAWAFWIPTLQAKFLYADNGMIDCRFPGAPTRVEVNQMKTRLDEAPSGTGSYTWRDWLNAYNKSAIRRTAEIYLATERLSRARLGPAPLGVCIAHSLISDTGQDTGTAFGIMTEDATKLPRKAEGTEASMIAAGVLPDKIRSCTRQQVNGYIVDLNSVVGVMPQEADGEVDYIESHIIRTFQKEKQQLLTQQKAQLHAHLSNPSRSGTQRETDAVRRPKKNRSLRWLKTPFKRANSTEN